MPKKIILGLLACFFLMSAAIPAVVARVAESKWPDLVARLGQALPNYVVYDGGFQRGWFRSFGSLRIIEADPTAVGSLHEITGAGSFGDQPAWVGEILLNHGLLTLQATDGWPLSWVRGHIDMRIDGGQSGVQQLDAIHFRVGLLGNLHAETKLADTRVLALLDEKIADQVSGANTRIEVDVSQPRYTVYLEARQIAVSMPEVALSADQLTGHFVFTESPAGQWNIDVDTQLMGHKVNPGLALNWSLAGAVTDVDPQSVAAENAQSYLRQWLKSGGAAEIRALRIDDGSDTLDATGWLRQVGGDSIAAGQFNAVLPTAFAGKLIRNSGIEHAASALAWLKRDGDQYRLDVKLADNVLDVNGATYPVDLSH